MALEIRFESARRLAEAELFDYFAQRCGADLIDLDLSDPFLRTPGMDILPYPVTPVDEDQAESERWHAERLGFRRQILVVFRIRGRAELDEQLIAWEAMLNAVIAFAHDYPTEAVLLYNGEEVLMRCRDGEIVFDTSEYFAEEPRLAAIVSRYRREKLDQPLMG